MKLIDQNNEKLIIDLGLHLGNLNFNISFPEVYLDSKLSPLSFACHQGKLDIIKILLENEKIDIDYPTEYQNLTPLQIACQAGHYEILMLLIKAGSKINKPNSLNLTPIFICFERLQEKSDFSYENRNLSFKMAKTLLEQGADINFLLDKKIKCNYLMKVCEFQIVLSEDEFKTIFFITKFLIQNGIDKVESFLFFYYFLF